MKRRRFNNVVPNHRTMSDAFPVIGFEASVNDSMVVKIVPGNVVCATHKRDVSGRILQVDVNPWVVEMVDINKTPARPINVEVDVEIRGMQTYSAYPFHLWWQWRPTDIVIVVSPGNPGWRPFGSRNPCPAIIIEKSPATVMVNGPSPFVIRLIGPSVIGINPVTIGIWSPTWLSPIGFPYPTVIVKVFPMSVGR